MSELDDLLAEIEDPDLAEKFKAKFTEKDEALARTQAIAARDSKVQKEQAKLAQKFPRAMSAFQKGRLSLPDDPSDEALVEALKAKEEELEDLGVPIPGAAPTPIVPDEEEDPAAAWGDDIGTGRGENTTADLFNQVKDLAESGEQYDRLEIIAKISEMNAKAQQSGDFSQLDGLNQHFGPKYPVTKSPPAIIQNLTPIHGAGANKAQAPKRAAKAKSKAS